MRISNSDKNLRQTVKRRQSLRTILRRLQKQWRNLIFWAAAKSPFFMENVGHATQLKHASVGTYMVTVIPILTAVSMGYLLSNIGWHPVWCFVGGAIWAWIVFSLDKLLLAFSTDGSVFSRRIKLALRLLMSLLISLVISEALLGMLFHGEIAAELANRVEDRVSERILRTRNSNGRNRREIQSEIGRLRKRAEDLRKIRDQAERKMHDEGDGTGGTFIRGEGANFLRRKEAFERRSREYEEERRMLSVQIRKKREQIRNLDDEVKSSAEATRSSEASATGLLAQREALMAIAFRSYTAGSLCIAVWLAFMLLETIPQISRELGEPDEYDHFEKRNLATLSMNVWKKIYNSIKADSDKTKLSELELEFKNHVYITLMRRLNEETVLANQEVSDNQLTHELKVRVAGYPDFEASIYVPDNSTDGVTLRSFSRQIEDIKNAMANGDANSEILRAVNTVGETIVENQPLFPQVAPDNQLTLVLGSPSFGDYSYV